jgi:hypothetical protein
LQQSEVEGGAANAAAGKGQADQVLAPGFRVQGLQWRRGGGALLGGA